MAIEDAIRLYNRYRSPEAEARVLGREGDKLVVLFSGSFCETCGIEDWMEDLAYILRDKGVRAEIEEVIEPRDYGEGWRIAVFKLRKDRAET